MGLRFTKKANQFLESRHVFWAMTLLSFGESIIIPIPLEAVLVPAMQKRRDAMWKLATAAMIGCLIGATVGYFVGFAAMETLGRWFVDSMGYQEQYQRGVELMNQHGFWFVVSVSVMPVPFQIAMIAAGATKYAFPLYLLATLLSRGVRYFGLAALVKWKGNQAEDFIKSHKKLTVAIIIGAVIAFWGGSYLLSSNGSQSSAATQQADGS